MSNNSGGDLKQKKARVPKRGPGVAELEKILKEEGGTGIGRIGIVPDLLPENFPFSRDRTDLSFPPPPVVTGPFESKNGNFYPNVGFGGNRNFNLGDANLGGSGRILPGNYLDAPPLPRGTTVFRNNGGGGENSNCNCKSQSGGGGGPVGGNGGSRGIDIGRSGMVSPANQNFFPPPFLSGQRRAETASDLQILNQQKQIFQNQLYQFQHSMVNFSPNPTLSSSSISSSTGMYHVEPPSNQRSYPTFLSLPPEENFQMSEGIKRQRLLPPTLDNLPLPPPPPPPFHCQIPAFPPQIQTSEPLRTTSASRDRVQSRNLEHNIRNASSDYDIMFGFPSSLSSPFPSQELAGGSSKGYRIPEAEGSSQTKPLYFFLQAGEEGIGAAESGEKREDSIDLNLKL